MSENPEAANPLYEANMAAFARHQPALHGRLAAIEAPHSQITLLPDDGIDITLQGQAFYGRDAVAFAQDQFTAYCAKPVRWTFNRPRPEGLEGICGDYVRRLDAVVADDGIALSENLAREQAHFAIVFGIGLGLHVAPLLDHTGARVVVLIEPMLENLYHSLFVVDWAALLDGKSCEMVFVVEADSTAIAAVVRDELRARNPAMLDGVYAYRHYASSVLANVYERVERDFFLNISGLGFFEDELMMMANGCANLRPAAVKLINRQLAATDVPLFIVGSGPSIDGHMAYVQAHRDRVMVMSIGTGLRGLLAHGVRPDFHVELENGLSTAYVVNLVKDEFGLDGISLIAPLTVQAAVSEAFDEVFFAFRERVTSTMLFKQDHRDLSPAGPTVANLAMAAAIRFGFRRIFLFGLDMGSRRRDNYHSAESFFKRGLLHDVDPETEINDSAPANFGGTAVFDRVLSWSRQSLEGVLRVFTYVDCVNCSDGTRIEGARPQLPETVAFDHPAIDHAAIKADVRNGMTVFTQVQRDQIWRDADLARQARDTFAALAAVLDAASPDDARMSWGDGIFDLVRPNDEAGNPVIRTLLYGTVVLMLGCTQWYGSRLAAAGDGAVFRGRVIDLMRRSFDDMARDCAELFDNTDRFFAGERDDIPVEDASLVHQPTIAAKLKLA